VNFDCLVYVYLKRYLPIVALINGCFFIQGCFFFPTSHIPVLPTDLSISFQEVRLTDVGEPRLHSWILKSSTVPAKGIILFLHGNAQNISYHLPSVAWFTLQGFDVFMLEYRGFGLSQGSASIKGALTDIDRAIRFIKIHFPASKLILFGQSIGATLGFWSLANSPFRSDIKAAIIESPFASYRVIARDKIRNIPLIWPIIYPLTWFISDKWSPNQIKSPINVPLLLLHGTADEIVPVTHSRKLKYLLNSDSSYLEVEAANHLQLLDSQAIREMLLSFIKNNT
jgi:alpha-beta hydrolase superfamily lysophospholipase